MARRFSLAVIVAAVLALAPHALAQEPWKAKGPATEFVPDWSGADAADAQATQFFLKNIWPKVAQASAALDARILVNKKPLEAGKVYDGAMSDAEKAAGVVCFPLGADTVLPWHAVPSPEQVAARTLKLWAAQGQSEPVAVGVHAVQDAKAVAVSCSDLTGPATIPASAVTTRLSLSYTVDPRAKGNAIHARQMVLLKVDGWDIPRARTQSWVVDVHTPADAKPGVYTGKVTVKAGTAVAATFDLSLEVLAFRLTDNGVRWGPFMGPNPGQATDAWCDLAARYGTNTVAWWNLDSPPITWTWNGCQREETVLAKLRGPDGAILPAADVAKLPKWLKERWDGTFLTFKLDEVEGLPREHAARADAYKKPLKLKASLGDLTAEQAASICYDRPGVASNFQADSIDSVAFQVDEAFKTFDAGMKRFVKHGFAGPVTWFGSGQGTVPWEVRVIAQRFGPKYSVANWKWTREVTPDNSNHLWYLANAAVAKSFADARAKHGWPEVVWCPVDESFQYRGVTQRSATNMVAEMMPYLAKYAPQARIYMVVWHTQKENWKGMWQCGVLQKIDKTPEGKPSAQYGPFQVICTNCPNDLDRQTTWEAGGEYWMYHLAYAVMPGFGASRFGMGFKGARHYAGVVYNYADSLDVSNLADTDDAAKSDWIAGEAKTNFYLANEPGTRSIDLALASHTALALRAGTTDRKYVETLRVLAARKNSADDLAFLQALPERIDKIGGGKGGIDDFTAEVNDESAAQALRREIAERIRKLAAQ